MYFPLVKCSNIINQIGEGLHSNTFVAQPCMIIGHMDKEQLPEFEFPILAPAVTHKCLSTLSEIQNLRVA